MLAYLSSWPPAHPRVDPLQTFDVSGTWPVSYRNILQVIIGDSRWWDEVRPPVLPEREICTKLEIRIVKVRRTRGVVHEGFVVVGCLGKQLAQVPRIAIIIISVEVVSVVVLKNHVEVVVCGFAAILAEIRNAPLWIRADLLLRLSVPCQSFTIEPDVVVPYANVIAITC